MFSQPFPAATPTGASTILMTANLESKVIGAFLRLAASGYALKTHRLTLLLTFGAVSRRMLWLLPEHH
jgi:hypothetical protein